MNKIFFKVYSFISIVCIAMSSFAHDANKAYFTITVKENTVEIEAELPWSIRNAIMQFEPSLKNSKKQADFDVAFFNYVKTNLVLYNNKGNKLTLLKVESIDLNGHSHAQNFVFSYQKETICKITNTFLLALYDEAINFHQCQINKENFQFTTTQNNPTFLLANKMQETIGMPLYLLGFGIVVILLVVFLKKS